MAFRLVDGRTVIVRLNRKAYEDLPTFPSDGILWWVGGAVNMRHVVTIEDIRVE